MAVVVAVQTQGTKPRWQTTPPEEDILEKGGYLLKKGESQGEMH